MAKWARVNRIEKSEILEIIDYDPNGIICEEFLPQFLPCPDETAKGYHYDPSTNSFFLPEGYAKHPQFESYGYVHAEDREVDENGFIVIPPPPPVPEPPKMVTDEEIRSNLKLTEKLLWDTPESGTTQQAAAITTIKKDLPQRADSEELVEMLELLETLEVIGVGRAQELLSVFLPPAPEETL
jgi:hypothetical protein